jgi:SAM-dependent methyltransferase
VTVRQPPTGPDWAALARLDPLAAVLDPGDSMGRKNAQIDAIHKSWLRRALGQLGGQTVLDFGCGTGRLTRFAADLGADACGVDGTPEMIDVARTLAPGLRFEKSDGVRLPFDDATFDLVLSVYVLQYYVGTSDLSALAAEFARVLRPGGKVVAIEQVSTALDRGADAAAYSREFGQRGFEQTIVKPIRPGVSRVLDVLGRHPAFRGTLVTGIASLQAGFAHRRGLPEGAYVDMLFVWSQQARDAAKR